MPAGSTETSANSVEPLAEVGVVSLVGSVETVGVDQEDAGAVAWAAAITADDANDALAVTVTGSAGVAIHWHAVVQGSEVVF